MNTKNWVRFFAVLLLASLLLAVLNKVAHAQEPTPTPELWVVDENGIKKCNPEATFEGYECNEDGTWHFAEEPTEPALVVGQENPNPGLPDGWLDKDAIERGKQETDDFNGYNNKRRKAEQDKHVHDDYEKQSMSVAHTIVVLIVVVLAIGFIVVVASMLRKRQPAFS
jgi:hypothetical protein